MTNYATDAEKAVKKFDTNPKDLQKSVSALADVAQSFVKDTKKNAGDIATEATKLVKEESQKNLRKAGEFVKEHPAKGLVYGLGIAAVLGYFLIPRKK